MPEEIDHIAELQKRLYARDPESVPKRKFGILRPEKQSVSSTWGNEKPPEEKPKKRADISGYKRFFIISLIFFLLAAGAAAFSVFRGAITLSSKNVDVTILGNSFVAGGETLPIQVEIANKNSSDLINATLAFDYPKGATDETGSEVGHLEQNLGTIGSGKSKSISFNVVLYGEQGMSRDITATLSYGLAGSTAVFQKTQTFSVMINSSPITLTVDAPSAVASNQPFTLRINTLFTGDQALNGIVAHVDYPNGFVFQSATPAPSSGNNTWTLGDLQKGTTNTIAVQGKLIGETTDEKAFRVYLGTPTSATDSRIAVTYNSTLKSLAIAEPFISGELQINDQKTDVVALPIGTDVQGYVSWKNNASLSITNPIFTLAITGDNIDTDSIKAPNAYYNALARTITWTADSDTSLTTIAPGATGQFPFTLPLKDATKTNDINLALSVQGTFPDKENEVQSLDTLDQKIVRYAARLQFAAQSLYSIGAIKNTGPFPPKANQETSYSIVWTMRPVENALTGAVVSATLPQGVTWAGVVLPQGEAVTYNPDTRLVSWNIGTVPKAIATLASRKVTFQVKVKPTATQVGAELPLTGTTTVTATDAVVNSPLTVTRPPLTTRLDTDPAYTPGSEKVLP